MTMDNNDVYDNDDHANENDNHRKKFNNDNNNSIKSITFTIVIMKIKAIIIKIWNNKLNNTIYQRDVYIYTKNISYITLYLIWYTHSIMD